MDECYFCEEGHDFSSAMKRLGKAWPFENEVVFYDRNVFAIVGSSPQVIPYILILPYRHIHSASEMTVGEWTSFISCMDYLIGKGGYGNDLCVFEHGGKSESGSSSIDHCHVHVIDSKYGLFHQARFADFQLYDGELPSMTESYLMVGKYTTSEFVLKLSTNDANHERQYFRRRLAEILGEGQWDWREDAKLDRMEEVMRGFVS